MTLPPLAFGLNFPQIKQTSTATMMQPKPHFAGSDNGGGNTSGDTGPFAFVGRVAKAFRSSGANAEPHATALATLETVAAGPLDSDYIDVSDIPDWQDAVDEGNFRNAVIKGVSGAVGGVVAGFLGGPLTAPVKTATKHLATRAIKNVARANWVIRFGPSIVLGAAFAATGAWAGAEGAKRIQIDGHDYLHRGTLKTNILERKGTLAVAELKARVGASHPTDIVQIPMKGGRTGLTQYLYHGDDDVPAWVQVLREDLPAQREDGSDFPFHRLTRAELQDLLTTSVPTDVRAAAKDFKHNGLAGRVGTVLGIDVRDPNTDLLRLLRDWALSRAKRR